MYTTFTELKLGKEYRNCMEDELSMAIVFGYNKPLSEKILSISHFSEIQSVLEVISWDYFVSIEYNGNIKIKN